MQQSAQVNHGNTVTSISGKSAATPAAETPTPVVVGELVQEDAMAQQQQDAVSTKTPPIVAHIQPEKEQEMEAASLPQEVGAEADVVEATTQTSSAYHKLTNTIMVTLDMSQPFMAGHRKLLSEMQAGDVSYNLYSPLKRGGKKAAPAPEGVARAAFMELVQLAEQLNSTNIVFLGDRKKIRVELEQAVKKTALQVAHTLPIAPETELAHLGALEDETEQYTLRFSDIVRVTGWVNSPETVGEVHEIQAIAEHNGVINVTLNVGALYDTEDKMKTINQIEKVMLLIAEKFGASVTMLLGVLLNPSDLVQPEMRELLTMLIDDEEYTLYTKSEIMTLEVADWMPTSKAAVERDMMTPNGELLLIKIAGEVPQGDEAEPAEGEAEPEAEAEAE